MNRREILAMLANQSAADETGVAIRLLNHQETVPLSEVPACLGVPEFFRIWKPRQWNLQRQGIVGYGLDALVENVEQLDRDAKILGFAYRGPLGAGQFFFRKQDMQLLGFVIVLKSS